MSFGISANKNMGEYPDQHTTLANGPQTPYEVKAHENNAKAKVAIISCLSDSVFAKVIGLKSTKEIWEKLSSVYEGDQKAKQAKLTNLKNKFGNLRLSDDENIESYLHRVNEIVRAIRGIGGKLEESEVVRKVMLTLPKCYKPKKYAIEESHDMEKYILDHLYGLLSAFEIAELDDLQKGKKEVAFKATKKSEDELEASNDMDEIEANFVRILKKGSRKYEGKLPFKYFNCGKIGHYASRCTYREDFGRRPDDNNKGRDNHRWNNRNRREDDRDKPKKNLCSMETYSSEEEDGEDSKEESLFLAIEEKSDERSNITEDVENNENEDYTACKSRA